MIEQEVNTLFNDHFSDRSDLMVMYNIKNSQHLDQAWALCHAAQQQNLITVKLMQLKIRMLECYMGGLRQFDIAKSLIDDIDAVIHDYPVLPLDTILFTINYGFYKAVTDFNCETALRLMLEAYNALNNFPDLFEEKLRTLANIIQYLVQLKQFDLIPDYIAIGHNLYQHAQSSVCRALFIYAHALVLQQQDNYTASLKKLTDARKYFTDLTYYPTLKFSIMYLQIKAHLKLQDFKCARELNVALENELNDFYKDRPALLSSINLLYKGILIRETNHDFVQAHHIIQQAIIGLDQWYQGSSINPILTEARLELEKTKINL